MRIDRVTLAAEMARNDLNCNKLTSISGLSRSTISAIRAGNTGAITPPVYAAIQIGHINDCRE